MPASDEPPGDSQPENTPIEFKLPESFVKMCNERGFEPEVVSRRLMELFVEVTQDAQELFPDWDAWSREEQFRFVHGGTMARANLEFPPEE